MINDLDLLEKTVATLTSTLDKNWVPVWKKIGPNEKDKINPKTTASM